MSLDLSEYMGAYVDGSAENLDTMDKMLLSLEQNPDNHDAIEEIFRAAHTLKGMSATMGFEKIAQLTHEMETVLDKLRNHQIPVTTAVVDVIFETFDVLRTLVNDSIEQTDSNIDLTEITAKLTALDRETSDAGPAEAAPMTSDSAAAQGIDGFAGLAEMDLSNYETSRLKDANEDGKFVYFLKVTLVSDCLLKGPRVFMILRTLDDFQCNIVKSNPDIKDLENEKFDFDFSMVLISDRKLEQIQEGIESISEIETVNLIDISDNDFSGAELSEPPPSSAPTASVPAPAAPEITKPATPIAPAYEPPPAAAPIAPPPQQLPQQPPFQPVESNENADGENNKDEEEDKKEIIEMVQLVTFKMAGETYALEIRKVEAIINLVPITRVPKAPVYIYGVINLRGEIVPVINTRHRLRLNKTEKEASNQIIILSFEDEKVKAGFLVDQVLEVIRLPETSIEPPSRVSDGVDIEYLKGVGKINGKIIILLNAQRIVFNKTVDGSA